MLKNTLVVVESPAKAKKISEYLGKNYIVRATVGHIVDLVKGKSSGIGVDIEHGFKPRYADLHDKKDVIQAIVSAAKGCSDIIIASDPDREGEAIAFHVYEKLKNLGKPIKRAEFHEITKSGIKKGIDNLRDLDKNLYDAQQSRRVLDRIVGFMVSPYLINKHGDSLSAGRVQSVALRLVVDREREIKAFIPEKYFTIEANLKAKDNFIALYSNKIKTEIDAKNIKKDLDTAKYKVKDIEAKEQRRNPFPPLTTADLQKLASSRFKISADRTMKTAQALYELGAVTYIRTDSYRCSPESIQEVRDWLTSEGYDVPKVPNTYSNKDAAQDAHEAIRPTSLELVPNKFIGNDEQTKIYRLIWEMFVCSQMCSAVYDIVQVQIEAKGTKIHQLKANGKTLKYKGWLEVLEDPEKSKDTVLPIMKTGQDLILVNPGVILQSKETKPPPRYNDGSMIDELKKRGIGRPSTYAAIITKISSKKYVNKIKNHYEPTDIGLKIIDDLLDHFSFMQYKFTADMELKLDKLAVGDLDYLSVMHDFYKPFREEYQKAKNSSGKDAGMQCPICDSRMIVKHSQFGFFAACISYPDCKGCMGIYLDGDKVIPNPKHEPVPGISCPNCESQMFKRDGPFGQFYSCIDYPKCKGKRKVPFGKKCSKCAVGELYLTVFDKKSKLACMRYPDCKNIEEVPSDIDLSWRPPEEITPKQVPSIERVLKKKVSYD